MSDRSLSRDMAAHAARTAGQPSLRQQLVEALHRHQPTSRYDGTGRTECLCGAQVRMFDQHQAEVTAAVVQPLLDAQHVEADELRTIARSAAVSLRDTAERVEQGRAVNAPALRAAAAAMDEITGSTP